MYILYLDESGDPLNKNDGNFVLAGAAVFERQTFFLSEVLNQLQQAALPEVLSPVELHASAIRSGRGIWRKVTRIKKQQLLDQMCDIIAAPRRQLVLFAACVEKRADLAAEDIVRRATEEVCAKFDTFLTRKYHATRVRARGLVVFDEGRFQSRSRVWVEDFRVSGTHWGATLKNLADIPYFAPSGSTRMLQVADLVAHATYMAYEQDDQTLFRRLFAAFDRADGVVHGLAHVGQSRTTCICPACVSRRTPGALGPWIDSHG